VTVLGSSDPIDEIEFSGGQPAQSNGRSGSAKFTDTMDIADHSRA
jgi:hypothetical protein